MLAGAGLDNGGLLESVWFGNCGRWTENQGSLRGQGCRTPLTPKGRLPERIPLTNVEGGYAIEIAEVHDATAFCEIYQVEMMGFCPRGSGGAFVESGATARAVRKRLDFDRPVEFALVRACLHLAMQAPIGSLGQHTHPVLVDDPHKRRALADLYRRAWTI